MQENTIQLTGYLPSYLSSDFVRRFENDLVIYDDEQGLIEVEAEDSPDGETAINECATYLRQHRGEVWQCSVPLNRNNS